MIIVDGEPISGDNGSLFVYGLGRLPTLETRVVSTKSSVDRESGRGTERHWAGLPLGRPVIADRICSRE